MKKILGILFCIALSIQISVAQSQASYSDYSPSQKNNIFYDDFSDNSKSWTTGENGTFNRSAGTYTWKDHKNGGWVVTKQSVSIDYQRDFEIEYYAKFHIADIYGSIFLFWGTNYNQSHTLGITGYPFYAMGTYGSFTKFSKNYEKLKNIEFSRFNKVTLRKVRNRLYFFMNEMYIFETEHTPERISEVGLMLSNKNAIELDYFRVSYLGGRSSSVDLDDNGEPSR